jgi:hypothetical protein
MKLKNSSSKTGAAGNLVYARYLARFINPPDGKAIAVRVTPVMNGRKGVAFGIATVVRQLAA